VTAETVLPALSRGNAKAKTAQAKTKPPEATSLFGRLIAMKTAAAKRASTHDVPEVPGYEPESSAVAEKTLNLIPVPCESISRRLVPFKNSGDEEKETLKSSDDAGNEKTYSGKQTEAKQIAAAAGTKGVFLTEPNGNLQTRTAKAHALAPTKSGAQEGSKSAIKSPVLTAFKSESGFSFFKMNLKEKYSQMQAEKTQTAALRTAVTPF